MQPSTLRSLLGHLRKLTDPARVKELSDADLLERFHRRNEAAAFTLLVQRHGPMVQSVCRRVLDDHHDAEDAFQATFLVLVRNASAIRKQQSLASFLHGVAYRIARKTLTQAACRRRHERAVSPYRASADPLDPLLAGELRAALDEEIAQLPVKYRMPLVLCYLAEKTHEQAAGELGWPKSSVTARLARARQLLQQRLARRGFAVPAGLLAVLLTEQSANAAPSAVLTLSTVRLAVQVLKGEALAAATVALADSVVKGTVVAKWTVALTLLAALGLAAAVGHRVLPSKQKGPISKTQPAGERRDAKPEANKPRVDRLGDPLPNEVVARIGSSRMRHGDFRATLAFTADGKAIVSGSVGSLRIWDAATGKLRRRLPFARATDRCVDFACTANGIIAASADEKTGIVTVQRFDPADAKVLWRMEIPKRVRSSLPFLSRDGKRLAYVTDNKAVRIYDTIAEQEILRFPTQGRRIQNLAFAPDGKTLAVSDDTDTVYLHDTTNGKSVRELKRDRGRIAFLVFSPDGRFLASLSDPKLDRESPLDPVGVWDLTTGKEFHGFPYAGGIPRPVFSPDGKYLALLGNHLDVVLWDVAARKEVHRYPIGHSVGAVAFSPDGKSLAASYGSGMVRLWDVATGRVLPGSADPSINTIHDLRFSADGRRLFGRDTTYIVWEPATGREMRRMVGVPDHPFTLSLSPDETLLASGDSKGTMHLWDAATGRPVRTLNLKEQEKEEGVRNSFFSADGRRLVSRGYGKTIRVWDVASERQLFQFRDDRWTAVAFSPDGRWLAAAIRQNGRSETMLWDLAAGREKTRLPSALNTFVNQMAFSPDSRWLAAAGQGESLPSSYAIAVWEVPNGKLRRLLEGHKTQSHSVSFSSDGRMLATGGYDGTLFLWELASGRKRHQFIGHESSIYSLAFSPDRRLLAAASAEAPAYAWDVFGTTRSARRPLSGEQLRRCWAALASEDAPDAFQAIRYLAAAPKQTLPFLREHLKPVPAPDLKRVRRLVEMLDSNEFTERQNAAAELEKQADAAASILRQILAKEKPSLEVHRRLKQILEAQETAPEALRAVRAVEVLEWIATPEAVRLLDELAKGATDARLTREAAATRNRIRK